MRNVLLCTLGLLSGCTTSYRVAPPPGEAPKRFALGVSEPWQAHRVLEVDLAVHDSAPGSDKPVLVCLHAVGHGGGDFQKLEAAFPSWRVISVDWPSHGHSGADAKAASARRYSELLAGLADELHLSRFALLGNSIGGAASVAYAAAHAERVAALVLVDSGGLDPGAPTLLGRWFIGRTLSHFEAGAREEAVFEPWFREYYDGILQTPAAAERKSLIVAAGYEMAPILVQAWSSFREADSVMESLLPTLKMPVLVAWSKRDSTIQWSRNETAVRRIPNVKIALFEGGHAAFLEVPEAFNAELASFLRSTSAAADSGARE